MANFSERTAKALGAEVMNKLATLHFCVVGCGGTGANFAELLVRSGATRITLIDGDIVDESNLNRVSAFAWDGVGLDKVEVLKARLDEIRPGMAIRTLPSSFREREDILDDPLGQPVRDAVHDSDVVFVGTDTNTSRLAIEKLHKCRRRGMILSCGILVDRENGVFEFECNWSPQTPPERAEEEGYGPGDASFASIIVEATSVAFTMLISHLTCPESNFISYLRRYDATFQPVETLVNGTTNCNTPSY
ncbi:MAG: ThiF family adenylyltransferase [Halieaceae bacterium]|nr:ThiF family adenylyltransferase [Halieaceae bacterium]